MAIDDAQRTRLDDWIRRKGIQKCPACGRSEYTVHEATMEITSDRETRTGLMFPGDSIGLVAVVCTNCATVRLLARPMMGL